MTKMWRVIISIVLILILVGIVVVAVGFMTGADTARIYQIARGNSLVDLVIRYIEWFSVVMNSYWNAIFG